MITVGYMVICLYLEMNFQMPQQLHTVCTSGGGVVDRIGIFLFFSGAILLI